MTAEPKTTTTLTKTYQYLYSNETFSQDGSFDYRSKGIESWGFSFYTYKKPANIPYHFAGSNPTREDVIAWAEKFFGNKITAIKGAYILRENFHEVTVIESHGSYEKIERTGFVDFHTVKRTTWEDEQMNIQYWADFNERCDNYDALTESLKHNPPLLMTEASARVEEALRLNPEETSVSDETKAVVTAIVDEVIAQEKKSWLSRILSR